MRNAYVITYAVYSCGLSREWAKQFMDKILSTLQGIIVIHYVENIVKGTTDPSIDYFN